MLPRAQVARVSPVAALRMESPLTMSLQAVQIFGTKKCADTRKAERFFKERAIRFQGVDLAQKGMSAGELRAVASRVGGLDALVDRTGKRYGDRGLKHAAPSGARLEALLLEDALLLKTPIVRCSAGATVGLATETWERWLSASRVT